MPDNLASGSFDGRDPAQAGEGSLAPQSLLGLSLRPRPTASRRSVGTDARQRDQLRSGLRHQPIEVRLQLGDLCREGFVAAGHRTERELLGSRGHVTGVISEAEACGHRDELLRREPAQTVEQFLRRRHAQALELVGGL